MCFGGRPSTPAVVQRDPKAEAEQAANEAATKANLDAAAVRVRRRQSALATSASTSPALIGGTSALAGAAPKPTLGA